MPARMLALLFLLLSVPALAQQTLPGRSNNQMWADRQVRPEPVRDADFRAVRLQSIHHDAEELATLQTALQSELIELQKGILPKDLPDNLKKAEKLSKKLRQEVAP